MASIINTGISALNAFKRQMETTGHNIANVNTEGYSRQVVQFGTRLPQDIPQGYLGSGVQIESITRRYDDFVANRVRDYNASYEEYAVYEGRARQIDNVIADASAGVDDMMQQFFAAVNDVADDPTSIPARQVMLNRANQLSDRFNALDGWFEDIRNQLNNDFEREVNEVNSLARSIADVNVRIRSLSSASGNIPNDILDERDKLIDDLSHYTNVSTLAQDDGSVNVFIGTGQALVVGPTYNTLGVTNNAQASDQKEIVIQQAGGLQVNVTEQMTGGSLGGLLRFRDEVLDESQNALGRVALGVGSYLNAEHRTGIDLDGELGGDLFAVSGAPRVLGADSNLTASFTSVADLTTHEYQVDFDGSNWTMRDLTAGINVPLSVTLSGTSATLQPSGGSLGFTMTVADITAAASGDSYRIRPTRQGASDIGVLIGNERDIAAADPLITANRTANAGTGSISAGGLIAIGSAPSVPTAPAVTIEYQAGNQLAITGGPAGPPPTRFVQADGTVVGANDSFVAGQTYYVEIPTLGTFEFVMSGSPQAGDTFTLSDNTAGVGDNRNARRLADMQNAKLMIGGTASFASTYGTLVADVGTKTHQAGSNATVQEHLLSQAEAAKAEISGVNLDEEAADLVRFQQAYQAAAQVINVANTLFDSLLSAVRR
jgi:flagellar hook-associated protein 1 FlgK